MNALISQNLHPRSYIYSSNAETLILQSAAQQARLSFIDSSSPDGFRYLMMSENQTLNLSTVLSNQLPLQYAQYRNVAGIPVIETYGTIVTSNLVVSAYTPVSQKLVVLRDNNPSSVHEFAGFGLGLGNTNTSTDINYQTPYAASAHVFRTGISAGASTEIMRMQLSSMGHAQVGIGCTPGSTIDGALTFQVYGAASISGALSVNGYDVDVPAFVRLDPVTHRISCNIMPVGTVITSGESNQIDVSLLPIPYTGTYLKTNKNFGIGTRTPLQMLHVNGSTYVAGRLGVGVGVSQPQARIHAVESAAIIPTAILANTVGGDILHTYMARDNVGGTRPVMCIVGTGTGGVGIGTDSVDPALKLQVQGATTTESLVVTNNTTITGTFAATVDSLDIVMNTPQNNQKKVLTLNQTNMSLSTDIHFNANRNVVVGQDLTVNGATSMYTSPTIFSDVRMKHNLARICDPLEKVSRLCGYTYNMVNSHTRHAGLIAQEVEPVLPEAVSTSANGFMSVSYNSLVPLLVESINQLSRKVTALEEAIHQINTH